MAVYEVEVDGKTYEVDAASQEAAVDAVAGPSMRPAPPQAPPDAIDRATAPNSLLMQGLRASGPIGQMIAPKLEDRGRQLRGEAAGVMRNVAGAGKLMVLAANAVRHDALGNPAEYQTAAEDLLKSIRGRDYPEDAPVSDWLPERMAELAWGGLAAAPSRGGTLAKSLLQGAKGGALGAALYYDKANTLAEKSGSIALGALGGTVLTGLVVGVPSIAKLGIQTYLKHQMKNADAAQQGAMADLQKYYPELWDYLTFAQKTGTRSMADTEAKAAGQYAQAEYRKQAEILQSKLKEFGDRFGPNWDPAQAAQIVGERGQAAVRAEKSALAGVRKAEWDSMIGSAEAAVTARRIARHGIEGSEQVMLDAGKVEQALADLGESFNVPKDQMAPVIQKMRNQIQTFKGQLPVETLLEVLKKTNGQNFNPLLGQVTDDAQKAFGKAFRKTIFDAIDEAPDGTSDAITWIKRARQSYTQRSAQIEAFDNSVVAKALGLKKVNPDPISALRSIATSDRTQQQLARRVLEQHDPQLLNEMRSLVWKQSLEDATSHMGDATKSVFDPLKHAEQMLSLVGTEADGFYGMFSKAEAQEMRNMLAPIRAIAFSRQFATKAAELEGAGMSAAGMAASPASSIPFFARTMMRYFWQPVFEKRLHTPEGRRLIMETYKSLGKGQKEFNYAIGRLSASAMDDAQNLPDYLEGQ